jgi:hypothetical protein
MSIHIDSCAAWETILVHTRSSVYELVVLRGDDGDVLVRGGTHFTEFQRVVFLGSTADGASLTRTIDVGLHMIFKFGTRLIITSPVQSLSRRPAPESAECATAR